jgi:multiple sugar transport system permease protein
MRTRSLPSKIGSFLMVVIVLLFIYLPILWLFSASLSTQVELFSIPPHWIPQHPTLQNYIDIFFPSAAASSVPRTFAVSILNSIRVASILTVLCLVVGGLAAYALVRIPFRGGKVIMVSILGVRMIPEVSLIIPLYIVASQLKLINTPTILIITYMCFALPYSIWMMAIFFQSVPRELEEAARLPISTPGLISTALFIFLLAWDEFFFALIFTSTLASKTVPVAIAEFVGRYAVNITGMMAGGFLAALPPIILAIIFQRYIVRGLTAGAVKG